MLLRFPIVVGNFDFWKIYFLRKYFSACFRYNFWDFFWLISSLKFCCFLSQIFYKNHHFLKIFFRLVSALIFFKKGNFIKTKNFHRAYIIFQIKSKYQIKRQIKKCTFFYSSFKEYHAEDSSSQSENFSKKVDFCDFFS
jgi:hypothetical protein